MLFLYCHRRFGTISLHFADSFHTSRSFPSSTLWYHSPVYKIRDGVGFRYSTEYGKRGGSIVPGSRNAECSCSHLSCPRFRKRRSNTDLTNGRIRTSSLLWQRIHNIKAMAEEEQSASPHLPVCLNWTKEEVSEWIASLGFPQYKVRRNEA